MTAALVPGDFISNRRAEPRIHVVRTIDILPCRAIGPTAWEFRRAELTDCSLHGLGLLLPDPMDPGEQFLAKLRTRDRLRLLLYTVQSSLQQGRAYRIGARFSGFAAQEFEEDLQVVVDGLLAKE